MAVAAFILALTIALLAGALSDSAQARADSPGIAHTSDSCGPGCTCPGLCQDAILGRWKDQGGIITFSGGAGSYQGHGTNRGTCGFRDPNVRVTGGYGRYSGSVAFYRTDTCAPAGDGTITITVAPGAVTASWHAEPPSGCCAASGSYVREGAIAPGFDYINRARTSLTAPCDIQSASTIAGGGGDPDGCGQTKPKQSTAANGANGIVCAIATLLGGVLASKEAADCVRNSAPPKRAEASAAHGRPPGTIAWTSAKKGTYKGFTTPVGRPGAVPTKKQLLKAARSSARFLAKKRTPPRSRPLSLTVAGGKSIALDQDGVLKCAGGAEFPLTVDALPLMGGDKFKASGEDTFAASAIAGKFRKAKLGRKRRSVAFGALYVSVGVKGQGACSSFVAFAARGPKA